MRLPLAIALCLTLVAACGGSGSGNPLPSPTRSILVSFRVEGLGMSPSLEHGDVVSIRPYEGRHPQRGDIVVFRTPQRLDRHFIKRIIGLPGEAVTIDPSVGLLAINGQPFSEPYAKGPSSCASVCAWNLPGEGTPEAVSACGSARCYFVLGDNRANSSDSRQGWLLPEENIVGFVEIGQ